MYFVLYLIFKLSHYLLVIVEDINSLRNYNWVDILFNFANQISTI